MTVWAIHNFRRRPTSTRPQTKSANQPDAADYEANDPTSGENDGGEDKPARA